MVFNCTSTTNTVSYLTQYHSTQYQIPFSTSSLQISPPLLLSKYSINGHTCLCSMCVEIFFQPVDYNEHVYLHGVTAAFFKWIWINTWIIYFYGRIHSGFNYILIYLSSKLKLTIELFEDIVFFLQYITYKKFEDLKISNMFQI